MDRIKSKSVLIMKDGSGLEYVFSTTRDENNELLPWYPLTAIRDNLGHQITI
ncbi:hypothetical protein L0222_12700 [bacterium]|nr:hypothetical protein [bacterium]